ncbi:hypothetical protein MGG_17424 [Pyricularia oryzae 70-15]|uniref:Uncharacterized protein n=1 Tax=Pyricularia oryzae (strain 70-15 / ATCC MYA-4617 / FGSC 8958) TaxID=242507 RepID=G4NBD7_PYRO7|nr:uncharacterized protein MGG_17424 [Pyricularia oryzae 70-15]EHA48894.1 hypothetical protein MGG_17424 [Pyricularia oryzae 70-15]
MPMYQPKLDWPDAKFLNLSSALCKVAVRLQRPYESGPRARPVTLIPTKKITGKDIDLDTLKVVSYP